VGPVSTSPLTHRPGRRRRCATGTGDRRVRRTRRRGRNSRAQLELVTSGDHEHRRPRNGARRAHLTPMTVPSRSAVSSHRGCCAQPGSSERETTVPRHGSCRAPRTRVDQREVTPDNRATSSVEVAWELPAMRRSDYFERRAVDSVRNAVRDMCGAEISKTEITQS
jgi:hypothetical protein